MGWDLGVCEIRNVSERHMGNCATYDVLLFSYFHFFFLVSNIWCNGES